jgi:hypothetical protein
MRALALLAVASLALGGCGNKVRSCKSGTVLLSVDLPAGTDSLEIVITIDGTASEPQSVALPPGLTHGTVELDFGHYPAGRMVTVAVTALGGGSALGSATSDVRALAGGCDSLTLAVTAGGDGGPGDDLSVGGGVTCTGPADCPMGQACDTASGSCTATCSATQPCNGGCCAGATCATGTTADACALGQAVCGSCLVSSSGKACLNFGGANTCGCTNAADCPANQACNTTTHTCGAACDSNTPCNGGCCSAASGGNCQTGTAKTVCGNNGSLCGDCTNNQNGHQCTVVSGGGQCGCAAIGDCPGTSTACSTANLCVNSCSSAMACLSGCCSAATAGTCQPGTSQSVCGAVGTQCKSCVGNATGVACLTSGSCGCTNKADCAAGFACDLSLGKCTTSCNANQPCNGGCCSAAGSCVGGGSTAACGSAGTACAVCANNTSCATYTCDGASCITTFASSSTICNPADPANCFFAAHCTGSSPNCPNRVNMCAGNGCCTSTNHCTNPCP